MDKISGFVPVEIQVLSNLGAEPLYRKQHGEPGDLHLTALIGYFQGSCWDPKAAARFKTAPHPPDGFTSNSWEKGRYCFEPSQIPETIPTQSPKPPPGFAC